MKIKLIALMLIFAFILGLFPFTPRVAQALDPAPVISGLSPAGGPNSGGTLTTISGDNFIAGDTTNTGVAFAGISAQVEEVYQDRIVVRTPNYEPNVGPVTVKVINPDGQSGSLTGGYIFTSTPVITDISPVSGSSVGGTEITVNGEEFQTGFQVYIDGKQAGNPVWITKNQVRVTTPGGTLGTKTVQLVNPDGGSGSLENSFQYLTSTVALETIAPSKGAGGTVITITGASANEFDKAAAVKVGSNYATDVTYISEDELVATVPPGNVGEQKDVTVINPDGAQSTLSQAFEYIIMPSISSITPNYGWVGDTVTIKGTNFTKIYDPDLHSEPKVVIGGFPAQVDSVTDDTLLVTIVDGNVGPADVTVSNPDDSEQGVTVVNGFTFSTGESQPQVSDITPNVGSTKGGTEVTITGQDFRIASSGALPVIKFDNQAAEIKKDINGEPYVTPTEIVVITPEHSAGPKDVSIINPDGGAVTVKDGFTYKIPEKMVRITSVTPNQGTVEGGTPVTLFGVNFPTPEEVPDAAEVKIFVGGNEAGNVQVIDTNAITAETPGGYVEEGQLETPQDVMIEIRRGTEIERYILVDGFTYRIPESRPEITEVVNEETGDDTGPLEGGSMIRIEGQDFRSGAKVYLDQVDSEHEAQVLSVETGVIRAVTPMSTVPGPVNVIVINSDSGQAVLKNGFVYRGTTMAITSITPEFGPVSGGTQIRVTGANFDEDSPVWVFLEDDSDPDQIARYAAAEVTVDPDSFGTALTAVTPKFTPGLKNVVVANRYGEYIFRDGFEYRLPSVDPVISAVTLEDGQPARGPVTGGTAFVITGMNFVSGSTVLVGGESATGIIIHSDTKITAVSPAGLPGDQDVTVVSPIGNSHTQEGAFFYFSNPSISKILPLQGSTGGGNIITITGEQFYPGASISFGSVTAAVYQVFNENMIKVRLPHGTPGEVQVRVKNLDGGQADWDGFLYKEPQQAVTITEVLPETGEAKGGTEVIIRGTGFAPDAMVHFGWEAAAITKVISPEEIRVITPANVPGKYDVTVSNLDDTGTAVAGDAFEYKEPLTKPEITGVFPEVGPKSGGTRIVITGTDFWPGARILIGNNDATEITIYNDKIYATTPSGVVGPQDVRVINPDGGFALLTEAFTYKNPDSDPRIIQIDPTEVPAAGGLPVTILGDDFREGITVYFDGIEASKINWIDAGKMIVETPPHQPGKVDVTVVNKDGGIAYLPQGIEYLLPQSGPVIYSVEPNQGLLDGGTPVIIKGDDFRQGVQIYFNGVPVLNVDYINYKELKAVTPPGAKGPADVTVMNTGEHLGSFTLRGGFTYVASVPKITSINPDQGAAGTEVYLLGEDFREGAKVFIGEQEVPEADVKVENPGRVWIKVPQQETAGYFDVKLVNPDGAEAVVLQGFRYRLPDSQPVINEVSPGRGPVAGNITVTISGQDFRDDAEVYFGGITALEVEVLDSRTIRAKIPPHSAGAKDVTVTNYDGGTYTMTGGFTYEQPDSEPKIIKVEPKQGPTIGETAIIITGNDFRPGAKVYLDGVPATGVVVESYKVITALTPPGREGARDVTVINEDQGSANLTRGFTYIKVELPEIELVEPNQGESTGGTEVTVTGRNFQEGITVLVGGNPGREVTVFDSQTLTLITPPGNLGWQEVKLKNPDGGFKVLSEGFKYVQPRTAPDTPGRPDTDKADQETIKVEWERVEFANYYEIYVSKSRNGTYRFLDQTIRTVYFASGLDPDSKYYFKIRAVNELGTSGFSYYDYAKTAKGKKLEAQLASEKIVVSSELNQVTATIASYEALVNAGFTVDFTGSAYQNSALKQIRISRDTLGKARWDLTVDAGKLILEIPPQSLYLGLVGSDGREEAYAELMVWDLGQQEAERALKGLPRGSRIISPVYALGWQTVMNQKVIPQNLFYQEISLTMSYTPSQISSGKTVDVYRFNENTGGWEVAGTVKDRYLPQLTLTTMQPARLMLVAH